jgi:Gluconate 2-dehydrogenase subunit 3
LYSMKSPQRTSQASLNSIPNSRRICGNPLAERIVMSRAEKSSSRRDFLRTMIALVPTISIAACAPISTLASSPAQAYSPRYFTGEEWTFLHAACARLIPDDENDPGAVELDVPDFIDREMDGQFGHATNWYMQGPFASALPELGSGSSGWFPSVRQRQVFPSYYRRSGASVAILPRWSSFTGTFSATDATSVTPSRWDASPESTSPTSRGRHSSS